jgi:hypothetical protein
MLAYLRRHHIGLLALFVALGGTSYAAAKLPRNSVGTTQIRSGAVTQAKLAPAVRDQLTKPTVLASPGATGPKGDTGATGAAGAPGDAGAPGAKGDLGPTAGAVGGFGTTTVTTGAEISAGLLPANVTTTTPGKVLVLVTGTFSLTCASACSRNITATLDGVAVPGVLGTLSVASAGSITKTISAVGIATGVPAGQHTVRIVDQHVGTWTTDSASPDIRVVALALGG